MPVETGLPFLGWRVYPYRLRPKRRNVIAFTRRLRHQCARIRAGLATSQDLRASVQGWVGHAAYGNTLALRRSLLATPLNLRSIP